jgi:hypothetical protein
MIKLIDILLEVNESSKEYQRQYVEKLKQDPEAYAKYLEKRKLYSKKHQDKIKQDP